MTFDKKEIGKLRRINDVIRDLDADIERLRTKARSLRSPAMSGMPRGGTRITSEDLECEIADLENRKKKFILLAEGEKERIQSIVDHVIELKYNRFLTLYYVKCMDIYDIAEQEGYSERHIWRIYSEAKEKLSEALEEC